MAAPPSNALDALRQHSVVVADTADFALLAKFRPTDATTNPSLVLAGAALPQYAPLVAKAAAAGAKAAAAAAKKAGSGQPPTLAAAVEETMDALTVAFGLEILKAVPGRVSTEVDARLSFDAAASVAKGRKLVALYAAAGIPKERVYIKLAATWEGVEAARQLEAEGIACNLTLLFSFAQAVACAQAGVSLVSPFVGRILDWHKKNAPAGTPADAFAGAKDPGVVSVTRIYNYYKAHGYTTTVMGASFRTVSEITELAGCDKITIAPSLLAELQKLPAAAVARRLSPEAAKKAPEKRLPALTQAVFLALHTDDAMGSEKLAEGIRGFAKDTVKLEAVVAAKLQALGLAAGKSKL